MRAPSATFQWALFQNQRLAGALFPRHCWISYPFLSNLKLGKMLILFWFDYLLIWRLLLETRKGNCVGVWSEPLALPANLLEDVVFCDSHSCEEHVSIWLAFRFIKPSLGFNRVQPQWRLDEDMGRCINLLQLLCPHKSVELMYVDITAILFLRWTSWMIACVFNT